MALSYYNDTAETGSMQSQDSSWSIARSGSDIAGPWHPYPDVRCSYGESKYAFMRGFLYYNTSDLSSKVVTGARIKIVVGDGANTSVTIHVANGSQGDTLTTSDWNALTFSSVGSVTVSESGTYWITLSSDGYSHINTSGTSKFVLIIEEDLNDTSGKYNKYWQINDTELEVTWTYQDVGVTTNDATDITETSATLNGTLEDTGGDPTVTVKFQYRKYGDSTWIDVGSRTLNSAPQDYDYSLTELDPVTKYEFRAVASNDDSTDYGTSKFFITRPYAPTNFTNVVIPPSGVHLSWSSGQYTIKTRIRYSANAGPVSYTSGQHVYFGSGENYVHSANRVTGYSYYYRAWGYYSSNTTGEIYSNDYAETISDFGPYHIYNATKDVWYNDLKGAIYGMEDGDYILISGNYTNTESNYTIDKAIIMSGQSYSSVISSLTVTNVDGFKLANLTLINGITLQGCSNAQIHDIRSSGHIVLDNSYNNTIYNNSSNNSSSLGAIELLNASGNTISGNTIKNPNSNGIYASGSDTQYNYVIYNTISGGNQYGIYIHNSVTEPNLWKFNKIYYCNSGGIRV